jgi:hypothetical protein
MRDRTVRLARAEEGMSGAKPYGLTVLEEPIAVPARDFALAQAGIAELWRRLVAADARAQQRPLLLSYDVHPSPAGPVLIEVNTNAGGLLTAIRAARHGNECCPDFEQGRLEKRFVELFERDLLGASPEATGTLAIVDDDLAAQPLLAEMHGIAQLLRPHARAVLVVDAAELSYADGRLRQGATAIDRIYWRSTDFLIAEPRHAAIRRAVAEGTTVLGPSPEAYAAIADKRRLLEWSDAPMLARDAGSGQEFRIAETRELRSRPLAHWLAERGDWVFKPASGYASRGVYVGKSISRQKLEQLPPEYLAQRYAPHPEVQRAGVDWKYDLRFFADRGEVIGAVARVFQGQVVGMRAPGSGFAPVRVGDACCLVRALGQGESQAA